MVPMRCGCSNGATAARSSASIHLAQDEPEIALKRVHLAVYSAYLINPNCLCALKHGAWQIY